MLFVGLGMPVLIGGAGYGVDMAQLYMWKRELQHSVDQAAIAGAWALASDKDSANYKTRAQQEFDANQEKTADFDTDPVIGLANYDGGNSNSVIVSASVARQLPFSGFIMNGALYVRATAQATFAEGGEGKACLMALKKGESGTFTVGGSATVTAKCGLGALSCSANALVIDGSAIVDTDSIKTCGTASVPPGLAGKVTDHATLSDSFADLPPPTLDDEEEKSFSCPSGNQESEDMGDEELGEDNTAHYLSPGRYTGGLDMKCKVVFRSGVYVIDGGVFDLTANKSNVTGTNVLFVLRNGAQIKLGGSGNGGAVNLTPMEAGDFIGTANEANKDRYAGLLFYEDKTNYKAAKDENGKYPDLTTPVAHDINGNANVNLRGTFYLPNGDVTVNGDSGTNTAKPQCLQLWALTVKIGGNTNLTTKCTSEETNSTGSSATMVRLVA